MKRPIYKYEVDGNGRILSGRAHQFAPKLVADLEERSWIAPFERPERDLVRVAAAIHSVDRLSRRIPPHVKNDLEKALHWQRTIRVKIHVEDPARWAGASEKLEHLLAFMTDDEWRISFAKCHDHERSQPLFSEDCHDADVGLFSGGLDSVVGTYLRSRVAKKLVAVSVHGIQVRASVQAAAIRKLQGLSGVPLHWASFHLQLSRGEPPERSQRCRGLLFLAIGAAIARKVGSPTLHTYENGIGGLNPPMNSAQVGAQNTRAMHPGTFASLERILQIVQDQPVRIEAPYLFSTKGQMCCDAGDVLADLALAANSCDEGERSKPNPAEHCGLCTSCLLRRSALFTALGAKDPTPYRDHPSGHDEYDVRAFEQQADRFGGGLPWSALLQLDPNLAYIASYAKSRGADPALHAERIRALFARHRTELQNFFAARRPLAKVAYEVAKESA